MSKDYRGERSNSFGDKKTLYPAVCDKCGKACKVPFKPSGNKPVYCSDCFEKTDSRENRGDRRDSGVRHYGNHDYHHQSTYQAPPQANQSQNPNTGFGMQLELLNTKLDQIISLLKPVALAPPLQTEVIAKPAKKSKPKKVTVK